MAQQSPSVLVAVFSAQQDIVVPLAWAMKDKMMAELDDLNWVFVIAFMAYMDLVVSTLLFIHGQCT